jgi:hypothetical protein
MVDEVQTPPKAVEDTDVQNQQAPVQEQQNIDAQIEEGLSNLPEEGKELLSTFSIVPEFSRLMGMMFGPELGNFLNQFADPDMTISIVPKTETTTKDTPAEESPSMDGDTAFGQPLAESI